MLLKTIPKNCQLLISIQAVVSSTFLLVKLVLPEERSIETLVQPFVSSLLFVKGSHAYHTHNGIAFVRDDCAKDGGNEFFTKMHCVLIIIP